MIPILYDSNETAFVSNGLGRLRDCIECTVTEERNGIYECDFSYPVDGANFDLIQCGRIIAVRHDDSNDVQPFDIISYEKPLDGIVKFHAVHISYRQSGMTVSGKNINSLADAFALLETASPSNPFTYETDFTSTGYMAAADGIPRTVRSLLGGVEGSILDSYGGEYEWDKWRVILHKSRGTDTNFKIRYGLNMLEYNEDLDYSGSYTSVIPYWTGETTGGGVSVVTGDKVNSGLTPYDGHDRCIPLDLTQKFESKPTKAQLQNTAKSMIQQANLPKQSIEVDFVRLQDLGEYEEFESLLQCRLCDRIEVVFPRYNMSGIFKIVRTDYDVLSERFTSMELGSLRTSLAEALGITEGTPSGQNLSAMTSGTATVKMATNGSLSKLADLETVEDGTYIITASVRFPANTTGSRAVGIAINDTLYANTYVTNSNLGNENVALQTVLNVKLVSDGNNIQLQARQSSGADMDITYYYRILKI